MIAILPKPKKKYLNGYSDRFYDPYYKSFNYIQDNIDNIQQHVNLHLNYF